MLHPRRTFARLMLSCAAAVATTACATTDSGSSPVALPRVAPAAPRAYQYQLDTEVLAAGVDIAAVVVGLPGVGERLVASADAQVDDLAQRAAAFRRENPDYFHQWTLDINWSVAFENAEALSLMGATSSYEGGAHGMWGFETLLWDKTAQRELSFADMFADPRRNGAAMTAVSEAAFAAWAEASPAVDTDVSLIDERTLQDARDVLAPNAGSFETFLLIPNTAGDGRAAGVLLLYPPYELGPYSDGDYRLFIPAGVLTPHLRPEWAARFGGDAPDEVGG